VHKPSLVLADEPTGNLDPDSAATVMDLLRECLLAENATAVLVTHSRAAARRAERALLMSASGLAPIDVSPAAAAP
jgi:putative ABC transport system ATP-binding protein